MYFRLSLLCKRNSPFLHYPLFQGIKTSGSEQIFAHRTNMKEDKTWCHEFSIPGRWSFNTGAESLGQGNLFFILLPPLGGAMLAQSRALDPLILDAVNPWTVIAVPNATFNPCYSEQSNLLRSSLCVLCAGDLIGVLAPHSTCVQIGRAHV